MTAPPSPDWSVRSRLIALALLFGVSLLSYLDRFALGILLPTIGRDLRLSDAQLGFVSGGVFGIVYAFAAVPLARLADRHSRRLVLASSVAAWSLMTGMCGLAQGFVQLAVARICVGLAQAGATAPANALIGDLFGPRRRATAVSFYAQGLPAGLIIGFGVGALMIGAMSWRTVLLIFAAPGLLLTPVLLRALPETLRPDSRRKTAHLSAGTVLRRLLLMPTFFHTALGSALFTAVWLSLLGWLPTFFLRSHGLGPAKTGLPLALVLGLSQMLGLAAGGLAGDQAALRDRRAYLWVCAAASALATPLLVGSLSEPDPWLAMPLLFAGFLVGLLQGAPALAVIQLVAGPSARAVAISAYLLIVNLIGGFGSQLVGLLSDRLGTPYGSASLAVALLMVTGVAGPWSALHFLLAARCVNRDILGPEGPAAPVATATA